MKTNKSMSRVERMHREKVTRYSIRKYSFGAASVAVAALFMFLGNGAVSADMTAVQPQGKPELKTKQNDENTGSGKVQGNTTKQVGNTVVAETIAKPEEPVTPALDKTKLEKYIKEIEAKLDKGAYANKTEKSVALLKAELAAAKEVLQNATTQAELTKAYSKLVTVANTKLVTKPTEKKVTPEVDTTNGQPTVGKKAENTEPKPGTNSIANTGSHDPRNGKAIDTNNPLRTGEQPAIEDDPYNSFVFSGNDQDFKKHSTLKWISKEGDGTFLDEYGHEQPANRNNESLTYGEDSHGKYIEWKSTQPRGGGFRLTIDKELGEEYTIGVKFAFDKTTGNWRKIVDYKNSKDDTGFYFNRGNLQFYNNISSPLGTNPVPDNTVVDFIIVKSRTEFAVYLVKDGKVTKEMSLTDPATLANAKPYTENGKTIFGFFFDDNATPAEATPGGRVYRMSIYDKAIDPTKVVEKLNKTLDDSKYEPELKNPLPDVKKGSTPNAEDFIKNTPTSDELNKLPANTRITWGEAPDTSTVGLKPAVILVTYPDGSADRVGVKVKVVATATPAAPVVTPNPDTATVTVTPTGDVDKVKVTYTPTGGTTEKTIEIVKEAGGWKEKSATPTSGVSVNPTTGVITLDHTVAEDGTAVKAVATKGNSDESAPGTATDPVKQATPAAPVVTPNPDTATVTVTPTGDVDKVKVTYTPTGGTTEKTIEIVKEAGGWKEKSATPTSGVSVNPTTGVVTLDHTVAEDGTAVKAVATKGNSDESAPGTATDPVKQATPAAPVVTPNPDTATVTVTPTGDVDKVKVTYTPTGGTTEKTIEIVKEAGGWKEKSATPTSGVSVNPTTGVVTLDHTVAEDGTAVKAVATKGNSDESAPGTATDPVKQATPAAPVVTPNPDTATVTVTPTGDVDKVKVTYTPTGGTTEKTIEIVKEAGGWKEKSATPTSGVSVNPTTGVVTLDHTVAEDGTAVKAVATKGNSDESAPGTATDPVKQATPAAPVVTPNPDTATVTVTPTGDVDKVKVTYTPTGGTTEKTIEIVKEAGGWKEKSATPTSGVSVNPTTGVVTLDHTVAEDGTAVKAVATKGNSDESAPGTATDPVKQATPAAPVVTPNPDTATVTVTPTGDVDKVKVTYTPTGGTTEKTIEIVKEAGGWKEKSATPTSGVSVNPTTGVVTLDHTVAEDGTAVKAVATKGNSDESAPGTATDPVKQATPAAPVVTPNPDTATVTVTPTGDVDKVKVTYTPTGGTTEKTIEIVKEAGGWKEKSATPTSGVSVNPTTGVVTLDHTVAEDGTAVKAVATKGNSDESAPGTATDPVKQATPAAPVVTPNPDTATVTVTPTGDVDKVKVTYTPTGGTTEKTIEIVKEAGGWKEKSATPTSGVSVNPTTGVVTLDHTVAEDGTAVKAVATKGNSDESAPGTATDPVKQATPAAPVVTPNPDTATVTVTPTGDVDKVKVTYTPTGGTTEKTIEIVKEAGGWKEKSATPTSGVSVNPTTGVVTLDHTVAEDGTAVKAVATKGNSDESAPGTATDPVKQATPAAPVVTPNPDTATVTVTPTGDVDKVKVTYTPTGGTTEKTIEIVKEAGGWKEKSATPTSGVSVNPTTGVVTLDHTVAEDGTAVKAVATKGNSDESAPGTATDPVKQATPAAPVVTPNPDTATVTVTPTGDVDKVKVTYTPTGGTTEKTIEIVKEAGGWKEKSATPTSGVSVNPTTGVVTLDHTVAEDGTAVKAVATKGNSDESAPGTATDPVKQATPAAPVVTPNPDTATVTVTPTGDVDKVKVTYTPTGGTTEKTIEIVKEAGGWKEKSATPTSGVSVNPTTGVVTLDHTVAEDGTAVKAVATKGNSDESAPGTATDPVKQATPAAPVVTPNPDTATVTVTPTGDVDKVKVTYTPTGGTTEKTIEIVKEAGGWKEKSATPTSGVSVNPTTGVVTLDHTVAEDGTAVKAVATKGNSDESAPGTATDPVKQATPAAPVVTPNPDTATVTVTPTGDVDKVKVTYTPTGGTTEKTIEIVKEAGGWKEKSATPTSGVSVNPTTGVVTLDHTVAEDGTAVKAVATKGNSDESAPGTATDPVKQATPAAPVVTPNPDTATVTVTPTGDVDKVKVTYTPTGGTTEKTIEIVKEAGGWKEKSATPTSGVSVNPTTGVVTLDHTVAEDGTAVKAVATKGNSDESAPGTATDPVKQATPAAPVVTPNPDTATVTVTPTGDVDKVKVTYTPTGGTTEKTIEIVKEAGGWKEKSATPTSGVSVNPTTGVITLDHTVAEDGTAVKAVATKGNSDESAPGTATDPVKQATPAAPTVDVNKGKLESAIHRLDDFINHQSDKLDENSAKKAKALLEEGKKVFADSKASQDEVDTMVKRIEDFISEVSPTSNQANPANNQAPQTSAVTPATAQAAASARTVAKELPNTGTADSTVAMVAAAASALLGLGLAGRRRKEEEEA